MKEYNKIACPSCGWNPNGEPLWTCSCGHIWDTFSTKGKCPKCNTHWKETYCPICDKTNEHEKWYGTDISNFRNVSEKLNGIELLQSVINIWNIFYNANEDKRYFSFRNFGIFELLTPKDIMFISHKLPKDKDKIHVSNILYNLKENKRIDEQTYERFSSGLSKDIVLVSNDYRQRLHKYHYPFFEISDILPIGINHGNGMYIVIGIAANNKSQGIYILNEQLSFPLFIDWNIDKIFDEFKFNYLNSKYEKISNLNLGVNIFQIKQKSSDLNSHNPENLDNYNYQDLLRYYESELKRIFGLLYNFDLKVESKIILLNLPSKMGELKYFIDVSYVDRFESIIEKINYIINQNLSEKFKLDMNYAFYIVGESLICLLVSKALDLVRHGFIELSNLIYLPIHAFSNVQYPELKESDLKYEGVSEMDENMKQTFLKDLSRY